MDSELLHALDPTAVQRREEAGPQPARAEPPLRPLFARPPDTGAHRSELEYAMTESPQAQCVRPSLCDVCLMRPTRFCLGSGIRLEGLRWARRRISPTRLGFIQWLSRRFMIHKTTTLARLIHRCLHILLRRANTLQVQSPLPLHRIPIRPACSHTRKPIHLIRFHQPTINHTTMDCPIRLPHPQYLDPRPPLLPNGHHTRIHPAVAAHYLPVTKIAPSTAPWTTTQRRQDPPSHPCPAAQATTTRQPTSQPPRRAQAPAPAAPRPRRRRTPAPYTRPRTSCTSSEACPPPRISA